MLVSGPGRNLGHTETPNVDDFQVVPETGCSLNWTECSDEITVAKVALNKM